MARIKRLKLNSNNYSKVIISTSVLIILLVTVGYAAFGASFSISDIIGIFRATRDIRITSVVVDKYSDNARVNSLEYSVEAINTSVSLPSLTDSVTFEVQVTNFGTMDMQIGAFDVDGELGDYLKVESVNYIKGEPINAVNQFGATRITFDLTLSYKSGVTLPENTDFENVLIKVFFEEFGVGESDITLIIYLQDRNPENGEPVSGSYTNQVYFVPRNDYKYNSSLTTCTDGASVTFKDYTFTIKSTARATCTVYFDALSTPNVQGSPNVAFNLFIEQTKGKKNYAQVGKVPNNGLNYTLGASSTCQNNTSSVPICTNGNTSNCIEIEVDNESRQISFTLTSNVTCNVYLDVSS